MKAIYIESQTDDTAAVYIDGLPSEVWVLHCIINPDDQEDHGWPETCTSGEMIRWRTNCHTHPVSISNASLDRPAASAGTVRRDVGAQP